VKGGTFIEYCCIVRNRMQNQKIKFIYFVESLGCLVIHWLIFWFGDCFAGSLLDSLDNWVDNCLDCCFICSVAWCLMFRCSRCCYISLSLAGWVHNAISTVFSSYRNECLFPEPVMPINASSRLKS
jgi:hypothetical protein